MIVNNRINLVRVVVPTFLFIFILLLPFFYFLYLDSQVGNTGDYFPTEEETVSPSTPSWTEDPNSTQYVAIVRLAQLSLVMAFGAMGSLVSLLTRNQKSLENLSSF